MLATRKKSSNIPKANLSGSIRKPVTTKKIGMKNDLLKNSSLRLAGAFCAEALMASPARNAPTMPGNWIALRKHACDGHDAQHENEVGVLLIFHPLEHVGSETAQAEQDQQDITNNFRKQGARAPPAKNR